MSYTFYGKRRTMTPVYNRAKAVSYRHVPYRQIHQDKTVINEEVKPLTILPIHEKRPVKQKTEPLNAEERKKCRAAKLLNLQASAPHTTLIGMIFHPFTAMKRSKQSCFIEYTWIGCLIASLAVWFLICFIPVTMITERINAHGFSYAVIPFSFQCMMAFLPSCLGVVCEMAVLMPASICSRLFTPHTVRWRELYDTRCHGLACMIIVSLIGMAGSIWFPSSAMAITAVLLAVMILMDVYTVYLYVHTWHSPVWPACAAVLLACVPCFLYVINVIAAKLDVFTKLIQ